MTIASTPPARLVVLGIDAARPELLDSWIADGTLPHLAALAQRGVTGRTRGVEGFFIGATWPSMYTGTTPARHGVHYLLEFVPGTYQLRYGAQGDFVRRPAFWRALSDAGRRVAILDVPLTRLEPELNGIQVVEWGGHDSLYGFSASPSTLATELAARYGAHPVGASCDAPNRDAAAFAEFVRRLEEGAERKGVMTCELLARGGWDLLMQVFTEGHCAGHQCWHLHDATHPAHDPAIAASVGDPLRRAYQAIDRAIGAVVKTAGDANIVVFSAHGMSHWYGAQFLLRELLVRLGATVPEVRPAPTVADRLRGLGVNGWRRLPEWVKAPARRVRRALAPSPAPSSAPRAPVAAPTLGVDVTRSRCFLQPNGLAVGGIRLNLAGREPRGVLQPGAEAEAFVTWLEGELLAIVDARTGAPLVRRLLRTATLYPDGEHLNALPDLLVEWSDATPTGSLSLAGGIGATVRATSPRLGTLSGANDYGRTGEHRPGGWLLAAGPSITPGRLEEPVELFDLAPTLAAMLGVRLADVDGAVIERLVAAPDSGRR